MSAWLTQADLAGTPETDIVSGFCDRCVTAGITLGRAHVFIDTLHPVHEGRLFRWGYGPEESPVHEYDRTSLQGLDASAPVSLDLRATDSWRRSPFYNMLQTGDSLLRRTLMETYLGRDAGQRMLSGRIVRGVAERIDAVVWFSDLRGFTVSSTGPEQVIPLLNDYSDVIVSAVHEHGVKTARVPSPISLSSSPQSSFPPAVRYGNSTSPAAPTAANVGSVVWPR